MKRVTCLFLAACLCLSLSGCGEKKDPEPTAEEVVVNFLTAFQQGDTKTVRGYIDANDELNLLLDALETEQPQGLDLLYRQVYEATKDFSFTTRAGKDNEVTVMFQCRDCTGSIKDAMCEAMDDQAKNGGGAFSDLPGWMAAGLEKTTADELKAIVHVTDTDGKKQIPTANNRALFMGITGGFYQHFETTMTTCTSPDGLKIELVAVEDSVIGIMQTATTPYDPATDTEQLSSAQVYADSVSGEGIYCGVVTSEDTLTLALGADIYKAGNLALNLLGILKGDVGKNLGSYVSLESTIKAFEEAGMTCVTNDFGSGFLTRSK